MRIKLPVIDMPKPPLLTFEAVVAAYIRDKRPAALMERKTFADEHTLEAAVRRGALGLTVGGKTYRHQWRVRKDARRAWARHLLDHLGELRSATTFHELLTSIERLTIFGIDEMTIYDTADRIGVKLGLEPEFVYLHKGTRVGARHLGLGRGRAWLRPEELPTPFQVLQPYEMEDCLCIYEEEIARIVGV
jgi:hypothetical protein